MIILPPIRITRGERFDYEATVVGQDWTGYTGSVVFRRNRPKLRLWAAYDLIDETEPIVTETVTGSALGVLQFSLTPDETLLFPALDRVGWFAMAKFEIDMTNGTTPQKFQGRASVAETLA